MSGESRHGWGAEWILRLMVSLLLLTAAGPAAAREPRKLALLVGISDYGARTDLPEAKRWQSLHCAEDVAALAKVLTSDRWGFAAADVMTLLDEQATRQGIVDAFRTHLLQAEPGDIALFYYGGHGQNLRDDDPDEEIDGLDQAFVTWDYRGRGAAENADAILRDDDLGELLMALGERIHGATPEERGNLTVVLDCCHAGTGTRGHFITRGRGWEEALDGPLPEKAKALWATARPGLPLYASWTGPGAARWADDLSVDGFIMRGDPAADTLVPEGWLPDTYLAISACGRGQLAKEFDAGRGTYRGALSYFLVRALATASPETTYRALLHRLRADLRGARIPSQDPELEGRVDTPLFGRGARPVPDWVPVRRLRDSSDAIELPLGSLHGVTERSGYTLYRGGEDQRETAKLAEATVVEVGPTSCRAMLPDGFGAAHAEELATAEAVETKHFHEAERLRLFVDPSASAWGAKLSEVPSTTTEGTSLTDCDLQLTAEAGRLILRERGVPSRGEAPALPLAEYAADEDGLANLREALAKRWKWQRLARLRNDSPAGDGGLEVRLVPIEPAFDATGKPRGWQRDLPLPAGGEPLALPLGSYFVLEARNRGEEDLYVTILDLLPNGAITPLYPPAGRAVEHLVPANGAWRRLPSPTRPLLYTLGEPAGQEIFKIIGTREDVDFSSLAQTAIRGEPPVVTKGSFAPLADLIDATVRGGEPVAVSGAGWAVGDFTFTILPRAVD